MLEAEDIGLYKFDILSQRGLGKIKDTLGLVKENQNIDIDVHDIKRFKQDENVKVLLRTGNTIGCFYVESPAMRMLLTKLKADDYLRLVAASSIIRPGVARSGMMREYIVRFRDPSLREKARAALPELYDLLTETYGVMVYQEDVIKVAHFFAGLSLAEADYLRRGMSWKFKKRDEFSRVKQNFIKNCRAKGHSEKVVQDIWLQVESFASFAFSKGHSASYAVESYQALFLKAYYPLEYLTATLNNGGGFYRKDLYLHEARMLGSGIKHPCVNRSAVMCRIEGKEIILGLGFVDSLDSQIVLDILLERERNGKYTSMNDLINRVPMGIETLRLLIRANALSFTGRLKMELLWEAHALLQPNRKPELNQSLFEKVTPKWEMPTLYHSIVDAAFEEIELFGFSFCSAFQLLKEEAPKGVLARDLKNHIWKYVLLVAELVTVKYARTVNGERMYFGTFMDEEGNWIDTVHFPPSAAQYPFTGKGVYKLYGRVVEEYDFVTIEIQKMRRLPMVDRESLDAMEAAV
jgi:DNA polymerase-3 subunit alpha